MTRAQLARRALLPIGGGLAVLLLAAISLDALSPTRVATGSANDRRTRSGLAAYAKLLSSAGHPVIRIDGTPLDAPLNSGESVVMLDPPSLHARDVLALRRFVAAGGELIAGGPDLVRAGLLAEPPVWASGGAAAATPFVPTIQDSGVSHVSSAGAGIWASAGSTLPVLGGDGGSLLNVARIGSGQASLLADPSPLENGRLADADNATMGLDLAGRSGRPVVFIDRPPVASRAGLAALPLRWKWVLGGLLLAGLTAIAARIRRLGAPAPVPVAPVPARLAHVEALAAAIARSGDLRATGSQVGTHARLRLLRDAQLPPDADAKAVTAAAGLVGLTGIEIAVLSEPPENEVELLAAGRALARISRASS